MREIKFRAWDKNHVKSCVVRINKCGMIYFNLLDYAYDQDGEYGMATIDVENMPIMQYTGLKDKNGVEIYEGDIVRAHLYETTQREYETWDGKVYWDLWGCCWYMIDKPMSRYMRDDDDSTTIEVIGNIYENPELLKEGGE